jgi:hypothetical protein
MSTKTKLSLLIGLLTLAASMQAQSDPPAEPGAMGPRFNLEGTWRVSIRPIFCSGPSAGSDVPGIPPVISLLTFARGGTMVESTSNPNFGVGSRSSGHGYWERTGRTSFQFAFHAFLNSPTEPYKTGLQRIEQTVEMSDREEWSSSGPVRFYEVFDLASTPDLAPYRLGCARANGLRFY